MHSCVWCREVSCPDKNGLMADRRVAKLVPRVTVANVARLEGVAKLRSVENVGSLMLSV